MVRKNEGKRTYGSAASSQDLKRLALHIHQAGYECWDASTPFRNFDSKNVDDRMENTLRSQVSDLVAMITIQADRLEQKAKEEGASPSSLKCKCGKEAYVCGLANEWGKCQDCQKEFVEEAKARRKIEEAACVGRKCACGGELTPCPYNCEAKEMPFLTVSCKVCYKIQQIDEKKGASPSPKIPKQTHPDLVSEKRGRDYPVFKDDVKMDLCMSPHERRGWFSDKEIAEWKARNPKGERQGVI